MSDITIIHGPQGTGKTLVAQALLPLLPGAKRIVDEWWPGAPGGRLRPGDIACTCETPPFKVAGARVMSVVAAHEQLQALGQVHMRPAQYAKAARRLKKLAERVEATAGAKTARERAARTQVVNLLAQEARRLFERNAARAQLAKELQR